MILFKHSFCLQYDKCWKYIPLVLFNLQFCFSKFFHYFLPFRRANTSYFWNFLWYFRNVGNQKSSHTKLNAFVSLISQFVISTQLLKLLLFNYWFTELNKQRFFYLMLSKWSVHLVCRYLEIDCNIKYVVLFKSQNHIIKNSCYNMHTQLNSNRESTMQPNLLSICSYFDFTYYRNDFQNECFEN